jgi:ferritin-like metal-binding protein YciE
MVLGFFHWPYLRWDICCGPEGRRLFQRDKGGAMESYSERIKRGRNSVFFELFLNQLYTLYWSEKYLIAGMEKMEKAVESAALKEAVHHHIFESEKQVERLERIFTFRDISAGEKKCPAIQALLDEGKGLVTDRNMDSRSRDLALLNTAYKIEHYEVSAYGSLVALARKMKNTDVEALLQESLGEEKRTVEKLRELEANLLGAEVKAE